MPLSGYLHVVPV